MTHNPLEAETDTPWVGRLDFRILGVKYDPEAFLCRLFLGQPEQTERNLDPLRSGEVILLSTEQDWAVHLAVIGEVGEQVVYFVKNDRRLTRTWYPRVLRSDRGIFPDVLLEPCASITSEHAFRWKWMTRPEQRTSGNDPIWDIHDEGPLYFQCCFSPP